MHLFGSLEMIGEEVLMSSVLVWSYNLYGQLETVQHTIPTTSTTSNLFVETYFHAPSFHPNPSRRPPQLSAIHWQPTHVVDPKIVVHWRDVPRHVQLRSWKATWVLIPKSQESSTPTRFVRCPDRSPNSSWKRHATKMAIVFFGGEFSTNSTVLVETPRIYRMFVEDYTCNAGCLPQYGWWLMAASILQVIMVRCASTHFLRENRNWLRKLQKQVVSYHFANESSVDRYNHAVVSIHPFENKSQLRIVHIVLTMLSPTVPVDLEVVKERPAAFFSKSTMPVSKLWQVRQGWVHSASKSRPKKGVYRWVHSKLFHQTAIFSTNGDFPY